MPEGYVPVTKEEAARYQKGGFGNEIGFGSRPALIIIDFMYSFTDPDMPFGANMDKEVNATAQVLHLARQKNVPVIFLALHYNEGCESELGIWAKKMTAMSMLKAGTRLVQIDERVKPIKGEPVIIKKGPSAFFGTHLTSLLTHLRVDTLIITGCTTSGCVRATVIDAASYSFKVGVIGEGCFDRVQISHKVNLCEMDAKYASVISVAEAREYLSRL